MSELIPGLAEGLERGLTIEKKGKHLCFLTYILILTYQVSLAWLECRVLKGRKQGR